MVQIFRIKVLLRKVPSRILLEIRKKTSLTIIRLQWVEATHVIFVLKQNSFNGWMSRHITCTNTVLWKLLEISLQSGTPHRIADFPPIRNPTQNRRFLSNPEPHTLGTRPGSWFHIEVLIYRERIKGSNFNKIAREISKL